MLALFCWRQERPGTGNRRFLAGLLPAYAQNFLPSSVTSRPLKGDTPTVDLVLGYRKSNQSPILKAFAFEIGRVGRSCLEEDPLKLGMPAMSIAAGEDALRYS